MLGTTKSKPVRSDAIQMLSDDHKFVKALFQSLKKLSERDVNDDGKADVVQQICSELKIHANLEEEEFLSRGAQGRRRARLDG